MKRASNYFIMFAVTFCYSTILLFVILAELHAAQTFTKMEIIMVFSATLQAATSLLATPAAPSAHSTRISPIAPPELTQPSILSTGFVLFFLPTVWSVAHTSGGIEPPLLPPSVSAATATSAFRSFRDGSFKWRLACYLWPDWLYQVIFQFSPVCCRLRLYFYCACSC